MSTIANLFGYILNFIYNLVQNYGLALILFSVLFRILLFPITYKQTKTANKTQKLSEKVNAIKFKYKNDQNKMNKELIELYKKENVNPMGGCLSTILQFIIIISVFYLVRSPLTYMKKVDTNIINQYSQEIYGENAGKNIYQELYISKAKGEENPDVYLNMSFLGIDLSRLPTENINDVKTYIIPLLYVVSSYVSLKLTSLTRNKDENKLLEEKNESSENIDNTEEHKRDDAMQDMTKNMTMMMPFMSVMIAVATPLGLSLYWLISNVLIIVERLLITKFVKD